MFHFVKFFLSYLKNIYVWCLLYLVIHMRIKDCTTYYCYISETNVYTLLNYICCDWLRQRKRLQNAEFKEIRNCSKTVLRSLAVLSVHTISPGCVRHMRAELRMDFSVACAILFGDFAVLENRILDNLSEVSTKFCCSISKFWKGRHHLWLLRTL